jgi:hypothetical protein
MLRHESPQREKEKKREDFNVMKNKSNKRVSQENMKDEKLRTLRTILIF